jgi:hypothetical protein
MAIFKAGLRECGPGERSQEQLAPHLKELEELITDAEEDVYSLHIEGREYKVVLSIVNGSPISVDIPTRKGFLWGRWNTKPPAGIAAQAIEEAQRQRAEWHDDEDDDEDASGPPQPVPPWCQKGILPERAALLQQALKAAGTAGLGNSEVIPFDMPQVVSAVVELTRAGTVVEIEGRYYLQRFASGAEAEAPPEDAPQPELADASIPPVLAKLRAAGDKGMSAYELMQAEGYDPVSLAAALTPLTAAGSVILRSDRYYHAAAHQPRPHLPECSEPASGSDLASRVRAYAERQGKIILTVGGYRACRKQLLRPQGRA